MSKNENDFEGLYDVGWVTADGTWGEGGIVLFHPTNITEFQYEVLDSLADSEKMLYVLAIVEGNENDLTEYENAYRDENETVLVCAECGEPCSEQERESHKGLCINCNEEYGEDN